MSSSTATEQEAYRPLEQSFRGDGFTFQLVARQGRAALFAKSKSEHKLPSYEVVIVQQRPTTAFPGGRSTPAHEALPSPEAWGTQAWAPVTWRDAIYRFKALVYDLRLWNEPCIWLWPDLPKLQPAKEWVLNRSFWEEKHGPPASLTADDQAAS